MAYDVGTSTAFVHGTLYRDRPVRVFDWDKAAAILRGTHAAAGLEEDWSWTSGSILSDGEIVPQEKTYTYLASPWATPLLRIDDEVEVDCWRYRDGWGSDTYWPESAVKIFTSDTIPVNGGVIDG